MSELIKNYRILWCGNQVSHIALIYLNNVSPRLFSSSFSCKPLWNIFTSCFFTSYLHLHTLIKNIVLLKGNQSSNFSEVILDTIVSFWWSIWASRVWVYEAFGTVLSGCPIMSMSSCLYCPKLNGIKQPLIGRSR